VLQQEGESVVDDLRANGMVVVEHQDEVARNFQDLVAERGKDGLELLPGMQRTQEGARGLPEAAVNRLDGRYQVQEEAHRLVVPLVQRDPGHRKLATPAPVREQRRLAETGRRGDDRQLVPRALIQLLVETRTRHGIRSTTGDVELGLEQLSIHVLRLHHSRIVLDGSRDPDSHQSAAVASFPAC
jgi:hypothetical protein